MQTGLQCKLVCTTRSPAKPKEAAVMAGIDLRQVERTVWRDYFQDGLAEILMGGYLLLMGLFLRSSSVTPLIVLQVVFFGPLLAALKRRVTYPRTGYVKLREGEPGPLPKIVLGAAVLGVAALVVVLLALGIIAQPARWYRWMPIAFGIVLSGVMLGLALRVRLARLYVVAAVALVGAVAAPLVPVAEKLGNLALLLAAVGAVLLAGGVVALVRFRRRYAPSEEGDGDGRA